MAISSSLLPISCSVRLICPSRRRLRSMVVLMSEDSLSICAWMSFFSLARSLASLFSASMSAWVTAAAAGARSAKARHNASASMGRARRRNPLPFRFMPPSLNL